MQKGYYREEFEKFIKSNKYGKYYSNVSIQKIFETNND